jgi:hypothetical protein
LHVFATLPVPITLKFSIGCNVPLPPFQQASLPPWQKHNFIVDDDDDDDDDGEATPSMFDTANTAAAAAGASCGIFWLSALGEVVGVVVVVQRSSVHVPCSFSHLLSAAPIMKCDDDEEEPAPPPLPI